MRAQQILRGRFGFYRPWGSFHPPWASRWAVKMLSDEDLARVNIARVPSTVVQLRESSSTGVPTGDSPGLSFELTTQHPAPLRGGAASVMLQYGWPSA